MHHRNFFPSVVSVAHGCHVEAHVTSKAPGSWVPATAGFLGKSFSNLGPTKLAFIFVQLFFQFVSNFFLETTLQVLFCCWWDSLYSKCQCNTQCLILKFIFPGSWEAFDFRKCFGSNHMWLQSLPGQWITSSCRWLTYVNGSKSQANQIAQVHKTCQNMSSL